MSGAPGQPPRRFFSNGRAIWYIDTIWAAAAGLPTEELTASPWSGRGRYRTGVSGWYLKRNRSIGVSTDGGYYVLIVAPERFGRWRGVSLPPTPPPLQVGKGGRDGDSVALDLLLDLRLAWEDDAT